MRYESIYRKVGVLPVGVLPVRIVKDFLSDEAPTLESVSAVHQPFYILICISTLPTQHTTFITTFLYTSAKIKKLLNSAMQQL